MNGGKTSMRPVDAVAARIEAEAQERTRAMALLCQLKHRQESGVGPALYTQILVQHGVPEQIAAATVFEDLLFTFPKLKPHAAFRSIMTDHKRDHGVYLGDIY